MGPDGRTAGGGIARRVDVGGVVLLSYLTVLFGVVSLFTAVVQPLNQLTQPGGQVRVRLTEQAERARLDVPGLVGGYLEPDPEAGTVLLTVADLPAPLRLLTEAPATLTNLCAAVAAVLVFRLLRDARAGLPFTDRSPARLTALAVVVVVGGLGGQLLESVARLVVLDHVGATAGDGPVRLDASLDLGPLVVAVGILALAEAFRTGRRLSRDTEGLV